MIKHLSIRIAWHDNRWNGSVCKHPAQNSYCIHLPRILEEKDEQKEEAFAGQTWDKLPQGFLPPCKAEGGAFMSDITYSRTFNHPYNKPGWKDMPHLALQPTTVAVPPFSSFAVPFWWMLQGSQPELRSEYADLPPDEEAPFPSAWVYSRHLQNKLLSKFFDPVQEQASLAVYYIKGPNPVDEESRRLIAGVGLILKKSKIIEYDTNADYTYPLWDRLITHGIRPGSSDSEGVLIPYHDYLDLPDDFTLNIGDGKKTKYELLDEIKLTLQDTGSRQEIIDEFSYGCKWVEGSSMLGVLGKLRSIVERIREHGIAKGPWAEHLIWIDQQIGKVKEAMGPFPSFANALVALGFQHGHMLEDDLRQQHQLAAKDDPWNAWEEAIAGSINLSSKTYRADLTHYRDVWFNESEDRKALLRLLSRFELSVEQIKNWFDPALRQRMGVLLTEKEILANPYVIAEEDPGDNYHYPIAVETIDNGLFEDRAIQGEHGPEAPQLVESPLDVRRIRALVVSQLKMSAQIGDTLLSVNEITERLNLLNLQRTTVVPANFIHANIEFIKGKLVHFATEDIDALQLQHYSEVEAFFRKTLLARAQRELEPLEEQWGELIVDVIKSGGIQFNNSNPRHRAALEDQVAALQKITSRKLSILHGPAGTGKTTVMGALFGSEVLRQEGILLLAPTGKARVKLGKMAGAAAYTIAQFLTKQGRFDWERMKVKFQGSKKYNGEQNVIIDECSMLTEDDLYALMQALDLGHVKRIILVGDPYQLPPIGAGRPFADLCNHIESLNSSSKEESATGALARLNEVVRTVEGENSDCLTLASWYSGMKPNKNADLIFSKLGNNDSMNDLQVECWSDESQLIEVLNKAMTNVLKLKDPKDYASFNSFIGAGNGEIDTSRIEAFQILTPVKAPYWGSFNLNRIIQGQFRKFSKDNKPVTIGDQKIGWLDKVIQTKNEKKEGGFPKKQEFQLSNGQLGLVANVNRGYANVVFAGIDSYYKFGYRSQGQAETDESNIELAYTITVHKSQGSDFDYVFLVIPKSGRIISRELIYTALTRAKRKLVLLVEGDDPHWVINLSKPQYSETAKRNTHIFFPAVREAKANIPYVEGLIHKTNKEGLLVRSKSEVIIANELEHRGIAFEYEREYVGKGKQKRLPDFTFTDAAGEIVILEHLGMLHIPSYSFEWQKKLKFYEANGFTLGENLFVTTESEKGAIDSIEISKTIDRIAEML